MNLHHNGPRYRSLHAMTAATAALELQGRAELADDLWRACRNLSALTGCVHGLLLMPNPVLNESTLDILREALRMAELNQ